MSRKLMVVLLAVGVAASGCATKKFTRDYVAGEAKVINERIEGVEEQVEQSQTQLTAHDQRITEATVEAEEASQTAQEALERAKEAGQLAEGKLLYEVVLTDQDVRFGFDRSQLSDEARAALDEFATRLKEENKNVYIEIQGHTDAVGQDGYNEGLGMSRAEAVRNYLNREHAIPLHRMNVISYGESSPVADNNDRDGRAQNRRVALVVLA
jgi:outer membrane protein OmpA-like peptidoglycan-associated protein